MSISKSMQAVKVRGLNDFFIDSVALVLAVRLGYLLIKVISVALSSIDWKRVTGFKDEVSFIVGCDVVDRVIICDEQVGQDCKSGDRVTGLC